ncbi:MAG: hypothetical protein IJY05_00995 [Clostridia bacterium]|nr:hypothetical protein [Clostridia bacterium]
MGKIKTFFLKLKEKWLKQSYFSTVSAVALGGILLFTFYVLFKRSDFFDRFIYELKRPFTWDTTIYYAIGKGMSHGLKPYVDMFETKPPMIFFLASISYSLTGDYYLCNFLSFFLLILTTLAPAICIATLLVKQKDKNPLHWILCMLTSLAVGFLLGGYSQLRSGEVQVELFGAFFVSAYLLLARTIDSSKAKLYSPKVIFSALLLMIGVMFKEPFFLIALAGAAIICPKGKDWLYRFLLPCAYGGALGVLLLLATGTFIPYLNAYLPHMLGNHINIYGSPFERMKKVENLLNDMSAYSALLLGIVLVSVLVTIVKILSEKTAENAPTYQRVLYAITKSLRIICTPFLVSFAVGLGGQYYNHHFIFALPCYLLCVILLLESLYSCLCVKKPSVSALNHENANLPTSNESAAFVVDGMIFLAKIGEICLGTLSLIAIMGIFLLPKPNYKHYDIILTYAKTMKADAAYLDDVLDVLNEDTYQYFGFNGPIVYAYTEHDPQGPVFFQDPNNLRDTDNFFANNLKKQMETTDVYVVSYIKCGVLTDYVNEYIADNFVLLENSTMADDVAELKKPSTFTYQIYVRR